MNRVVCAIALLITVACGSTTQAWDSQLVRSLVFYAPFDGSPDAQIARGDRTLYHAPKMEFPAKASAGLPGSKVVTLEPTGGVRGGCLRFHSKTDEMVFFEANKNMPYSKARMKGTVSFWLKLTPDEDLQPGFCDPIQITSKGWNNAAFFVEFSKDEKPREFRLGIYPDFVIWNPMNRDWNSIPMSEKPLAAVVEPPFRRDSWTHVAFTFENFNTGKGDGIAKLYLNGEHRTTLAPRTQTFTWDLQKAMIMLGLSYIGDFDELAIFDRALSSEDVKLIYSRKSIQALIGKED